MRERKESAPATFKIGYERESYLVCQKCGASVATLVKVIAGARGEPTIIRDHFLFDQHDQKCRPPRYPCPGCYFMAYERDLPNHVMLCDKARAMKSTPIPHDEKEELPF